MTEQIDQELFRIEAEVRDENAAQVLRETIERVPECRLTAFDEAVIDDD